MAAVSAGDVSVGNPSPRVLSQSWSSLAGGSDNASKCFKPTLNIVNGVADVVVPDEFVMDDKPLWGCYLLGHFIGEAPHVGTVHATVNRLWGLPDKKLKIDVQFLNKTAVLFRIENDAVRMRVLRRKFWHIGEIPLMIDEWKPETEASKPDFASIPMWVDFKGVPGCLFSNYGLKLVSGLVGKSIKLHPKTERCVRFDTARVLVEIDLQKPRPELINLNYKGVKYPIGVSFPWIPPQCGSCSKWGHSSTNCVGKKVCEQVDVEVSVENIVGVSAPNENRTEEGGSKQIVVMSEVNASEVLPVGPLHQEGDLATAAKPTAASEQAVTNVLDADAVPVLQELAQELQNLIVRRPEATAAEMSRVVSPKLLVQNDDASLSTDQAKEGVWSQVPSNKASPSKIFSGEGTSISSPSRFQVLADCVDDDEQEDGEICKENEADSDDEFSLRPVIKAITGVENTQRNLRPRVLSQVVGGVRDDKKAMGTGKNPKASVRKL